jgi:hypothetical protein
MFDNDDSFESVGIAVGDSWGIYCPQIFCQRYERNEEVSQNDWDCCLEGPSWEDENGNTVHNEWYWEAWNSITENWYQIENGKKITAYQDGDVFLVREKQ